MFGVCCCCMLLSVVVLLLCAVVCWCWLLLAVCRALLLVVSMLASLNDVVVDLRCWWLSLVVVAGGVDVCLFSTFVAFVRWRVLLYCVVRGVVGGVACVESCYCVVCCCCCVSLFSAGVAVAVVW